MKIEFLAEGSPDCPLIRFYDGTGDDISALADTIDRLIAGHPSEISLSRERKFSMLNFADLRLSSEPGQPGVAPLANGFLWRQSKGGWTEVRELLEPFLQPMSGNYFQWLDLDRGEIAVLFSPGREGRW
jgi:hypothetical protein